MSDEVKSFGGWLKWLIIAVIVIVLVVIGIKSCGGPKPAAAADLSGIVAVGSEKITGSDITNVSNTLIRLSASQDVNDKAKAKIEADLIGGLAVVNQAWLSIGVQSVNLKAGKMLVPFGIANQTDIADQKLIRAAAGGNSYDTGLEASGIYGNLGYQVAALNGDTTNSSYDAVVKAVAGLKVIDASISYYEGKAGVDNKKFTKTGLGLTTTLKSIGLVGEYIEAKDVAGIKSVDEYAQASFNIGGVEPAVRYEVLIPNKDVSGDNTTILTLGLNGYIQGAKWSINYEMPKETPVDVDNNIIIAQASLKF